MARTNYLDSLSDEKFQLDVLYEQYWSTFEPEGVMVVICHAD